MARQYLLSELPETREVVGFNGVLDTKFPHVADQIVLFWGVVEMYEYFDKITTIEKTPSTRNDGIERRRGILGRQGFPPNAMVEINKLMTRHQELYPDTRPGKQCVWMTIAD